LSQVFRVATLMEMAVEVASEAVSLVEAAASEAAASEVVSLVEAVASNFDLKIVNKII